MLGAQIDDQPSCPIRDGDLLCRDSAVAIVTDDRDGFQTNLLPWFLQPYPTRAWFELPPKRTANGHPTALPETACWAYARAPLDARPRPSVRFDELFPSGAVSL
jgi:hypothetical protein